MPPMLDEACPRTRTGSGAPVAPVVMMLGQELLQFVCTRPTPRPADAQHNISLDFFISIGRSYYVQGHLISRRKCIFEVIKL